MASPLIEFDKIVALSSLGGYNATPYLSQQSGAFLLSACLVMRQKWLWQNPIAPISPSEYESIIELIEIAESDLMTSVDIGAVIASIALLPIESGYVLLDGTLLDGSQYPELYDVAPSSWVVGTDIQLPNMTDTGIFGENGDVGDIIGENDVTLTIGQLASHSHTNTPHTHSYIQTGAIPTAAGLEPTLADITTTIPSITGATGVVIDSTGNDESHNNIQQSLRVYWFIKAK